MNALAYLDAWLEAESENAALRRLVSVLLVQLARSRALTSETRDLIEASFPNEKGGVRDAA